MMTPKKIASLIALSLASSALAQVGTPSAPAAAQPTTAVATADTWTGPTFKYEVETVVENVEVPWAFAWTPQGTMLFTERAGRVREVVNGKVSPEPLLTLSLGSGRSEIGLMGMCLHPEYAKNKWVYLAHGKAREDVRVVRYRHEGSTLVEDKVLVKITPAGPNHAGCRIAFGPDGMLYVTAGEAFQMKWAQDLTSLAGKVLRITDEGGVPADNPFVGEEHQSKGVRGEIWAYGCRNPQGIDWQPGTGDLYEVEHGPSGERIGGESRFGGDEFNRIERGGNYGWPVIHHDLTKEGMHAPLAAWDAAVAPASGVFYNADAFPELKGSFLVGLLGGLGDPRRSGILRITLENGRVASQERLVTDLGRIRCVAVGPDGYVYFSTSNRDGRARPFDGDDKILRLVPVKAGK